MRSQVLSEEMSIISLCKVTGSRSEVVSLERKTTCFSLLAILAIRGIFISRSWRGIVMAAHSCCLSTYLLEAFEIIVCVTCLKIHSEARWHGTPW